MAVVLQRRVMYFHSTYDRTSHFGTPLFLRTAVAKADQFGFIQLPSRSGWCRQARQCDQFSAAQLLPGSGGTRSVAIGAFSTMPSPRGSASQAFNAVGAARTSTVPARRRPDRLRAKVLPECQRPAHRLAAGMLTLALWAPVHTAMQA